jgi:hypothetical protein
MTMNAKEAGDIAALASLVAESIRRQGAAYGSPDDWRRDVTAADKLVERYTRKERSLPR